MDMNRTFAIIFGSLGGMTGFSLNQLLFSIFTESANTIYVYICGIAFAALFALIFTVGADYIYKKMQDILDEAELLFQRTDNERDRTGRTGRTDGTCSGKSYFNTALRSAVFRSYICGNAEYSSVLYGMRIRRAEAEDCKTPS